MAVSSQLAHRSQSMSATWRKPALDKERRLAKIRVSFVMLATFLKAKITHEMVGTDAPEDLEVIGVSSDLDQIYSTHCCWIICRSEKFDLVPDGMRIPEIDFRYWRLDD